MSQANVDKLRRGYEAFNRGEYDAALAFCHPEIEFFPPGDQPPIEVPRGFALGWNLTRLRRR